jgi:hypothetical protein
LRFGDAALALGLLSQAEIDSALGEQFGVGSKDLYNGSADKKLRFFTRLFPKKRKKSAAYVVNCC